MPKKRLLPVYKLPQIFQHRDAMLADLKLYYGGTQPQGVEFENFVTMLMCHLPLETNRDAVFRSVLPLLGRTLEVVDLAQLAWRLAANVKALKRGEAVLPWRPVRAEEWVPLQIIDSLYRHNPPKGYERGFTYTMRVLAGTPAGMRTVQFWSHRYAKVVARRLGFTSPRPLGDKLRFPYKDGMELHGLRFFGCIDPVKCVDGMPGFEKLSVPGSCVTYNRTILKARLKVEPKCPNDYKHSCYLCWVGTDRCVAGCHPRTYTLKLCPGCKRPDAGFDPMVSEDVCTLCARAGTIKQGDTRVPLLG